MSIPPFTGYCRSTWNRPTSKNIDWARNCSAIMRGKECWWRLPLLDFPSNSFHKTWQSAKQSIVCETRKSIILVEEEDGQMVAASLFLGGFRLSLDPKSRARQPTFSLNSSFSRTPDFTLLQFSKFFLTSQHFTPINNHHVHCVVNISMIY